MDLISRKWAMLVINAIGNRGKARYNEIAEMLNGINSRTLACRLRELEGFGLIVREAYAEIPPRVEYSLTERGVELRKAIMPLMDWAYMYTSVTGDGASPCDVAHDSAPHE
ncbi:MAG: winged helix-turn-helix transcriptional regulator [Thermoplasmata archaeon]